MKSFQFTRFIKAQNQQTPEVVIYSGNFAKDEYGNSIIRTDEEMESCDEED